MKNQRLNLLRSACILFWAATAVATSSAHAQWARTTLNSISVNSAMSGPNGTWLLNESRNITDSRSTYQRFLQGTSGASSAPSWYQSTAYMGNVLEVYTNKTTLAGVQYDDLNLQQRIGSTGWNPNAIANSITLSGSISITFDAATKVFRNPTGLAWTCNGSTFLTGTNFAAGTYAFNYSYTWSSTTTTTGSWDTLLRFGPGAAVPAPGVMALLGAAGLLGRRRRA